MLNPLDPEIRRQIYAQRKSFTPAQERAIRQAASSFSDETRLLCQLLYLTGCRLSEALNLRINCIDTEGLLIVFHTLKQRKQKRLRAVPVPEGFIQALCALPRSADGRFWSYSRWTARRRVKEVLHAAQIHGALAHSRTFRHSYNDRGKRVGVPEPVRRALMGHRSQSANNAYGMLISAELHHEAQQLWGNRPACPH
nr:site-specific integrase [Ruegeria sp. PR1b]